ncbi:MAG: aldo/keto reductase, partial [Candidatus Omnitrophota bacterium]
MNGKEIKLPKLLLGTWSFGNDKWWGAQSSKQSLATLETALDCNINFIDTAPCYGRGNSEKIIGEFLKSRKRNDVFIATKLGLSWKDNSPVIFHDLSPEKMKIELDLSRKRLNTDIIDLYQIHWPDENTPIEKYADMMLDFYNKGFIRFIGVSNFSVKQITEFMRYCPLHTVQPQYSMFFREIEDELVPFCQQNNIKIITYAPLYSGILTGKFHLKSKAIPTDINRKNKINHFKEPLFSIDKKTLQSLVDIANKADLTMAQLAIIWNFSQNGISAAIFGARNPQQIRENSKALNVTISDD